MAAQSGSIRAGRAFIEIFGDKSALVKVLRSAQADLVQFASRVKAIGRQLFLSASGMATGLFAATKMFANTGQELNRVTRLTGATTAGLSALQFAATQTGASVDSVGQAIESMQSQMVNAIKGSDEAAISFARLGISSRTLAGLRPEEQFRLIADRLSKIRNPAIQTALATEIFGGSVQELLPLIQQGAKGIASLEDQARALGVVWSVDDQKAATLFAQSLDQLWWLLKAVKNQIGAALAPVLSDLALDLSRVLAGVVKWVRENRGLVVSVAKLLAVGVAVGAALAAISLAASGLSVAFGGLARVSILFGSVMRAVWGAGAIAIRVLQVPLAAIGAAFAKLAVVVGAALKGGFAAAVSAIGAMITPIGVLGIALVALGGYFLYASGLIQSAIGGIATQFGELKADVSAAMGGMRDALMAGDVALAGKILWLLLAVEWQRGIAFLNQLWQDFKAFFLSTWNEASSNLSGVFLEATAAISAVWTETVGFLADVWSMFTTSLQKGWFSTIGFIQKAWVKLKGMFDKDLDVKAEIERIDKETSGKNEAVDAERDSGIAGRDAARRERLKEIEDSRKASLAENERMRQEANARIRGQADTSVSATQQQLTDSRAELDKALDEAAKKAAARKGKKPGTPELELGADLDVSQRQVSAVGTFSGMGLRGLGAGGGAMEDIKRTNRIIAENTDPRNIRTEKHTLH